MPMHRHTVLDAHGARRRDFACLVTAAGELAFGIDTLAARANLHVE